MKLKQLFVSVALVASCNLVVANDYPPPVQALQDKGVEIVDSFTAQNGMQAYVAIYYGMPLALYLTPDGEHAIVGTLVDNQGQDLTAEVLDEKVNRPQSEQLWQKLADNSHWIAEGKADAPTTVYIFTDPNCPYCKRLWNDIRPWIESGKVQARHIPVGVLGESSEKKSAYILAAKDSLKALVDNESGKRSAEEINIAPKQQQQLEDNLILMQQLGASGTPAIFFRDEKGLLQLHPGAAMGEELVTIFGSKP